MRYGYIYKTTLPPSEEHPYERFYIGQHRSPEWDPNYFGSGHVLLKWLKGKGIKRPRGHSDEIRALGIKCELLEWAFSVEELNELEYKYVPIEVVRLKECINLRTGGNQHGFSEETRERISKANKERKCSEERKKQMAKISSESKWYNDGINEFFLRGEHPEFFNGRLKWNYDDKRRQERSIKYSGKGNPKAKKVQCHTGEIFECISDAAIWCGLKRVVSICDCCNGKRKYTGKHPVTGEKLTWKYFNN